VDLRSAVIRPFGTAAQLTTIPAEQAVPLPNRVSDGIGACLGIPGITARRAVFGDGPVAGRTVLVHGILGGVSSMAAHLAAWDGAAVVGTVRRSSDAPRVDDASAHCVALDEDDPAAAIRQVAPDGVHRIVEVAFSDNVDLDAAVAAPEAVIAAYATRSPRPDFDFWTMLFVNLTIRLLGSDDFPAAAKHQAAADLTAAAQDGALRIPIDDPLSLDRIAEAHDRVDAGARRRILLSIPVWANQGCKARLRMLTERPRRGCAPGRHQSGAATCLEQPRQRNRRGVDAEEPRCCRRSRRRVPPQTDGAAQNGASGESRATK
jgi:NADPH2:quinone reductase